MEQEGKGATKHPMQDTQILLTRCSKEHTAASSDVSETILGCFQIASVRSLGLVVAAKVTRGFLNGQGCNRVLSQSAIPVCLKWTEGSLDYLFGYTARYVFGIRRSILVCEMVSMQTLISKFAKWLKV